jgi:malonate transporter and related proteins
VIEGVILAFVPALLLMALGASLRAASFVGDGFWPGAERISYFILVPCLFIHSLSMTDLTGVPVAQLAPILAAPIVLASAVLVAFRPLMSVDGPGFTSVFQGSIRFNNYLGATIASGLYGATGLALAAVATAVIVPTVNILCVLIFARFGPIKPSIAGIFRSTAFNPLITGCLIGVLLQIAKVRLPVGLEPAFKSLGAASLPLGLLCVGAAFKGGDLLRSFRPAILASLVKFALLPLIAAAVLSYYRVNGPAAGVSLLYLTLPTASASYIVAKQMGGDAPMMAGIVALQTLLGIIITPLVLVAVFQLTSA